MIFNSKNRYVTKNEINFRVKIPIIKHIKDNIMVAISLVFCKIQIIKKKQMLFIKLKIKKIIKI